MGRGYDSAERNRAGAWDVDRACRTVCDCLFFESRRERCQEESGRDTHAQSNSGHHEGISFDTGSQGGEVRGEKRGMMAMVSMARMKVREYWLIALVLVIGFMALFPQAGIEIYPIIDTKGANLTVMPTYKKLYSCGDMVMAFAEFQKQRAASGYVKWTLVRESMPGKPNGYRLTYPPRVISASPGIISAWIDIEPLPDTCIPGKYHFEGSFNYKLLLGTVSYPLRTSCFEVQ